MSKHKLVRLLCIVALALGCMTTVGAGPAQGPPEGVPDPGPPPHGMKVKVFVHPVRGEARGLQREEAPAIIQEDPSNDATQYGYSGIRWQDPSGIPYWINTNFSTTTSPNLTKPKAVEAIKVAFQTWMDGQAAQTDGARTGAALVYTYKGNTGVTGPKLDGKNVVAWKPLRLGWIAVAYVWYYTATGNIAEFDILFNNLYSWTYTQPTGIDGTPYDDPDNLGRANTFDLRNIATHEAGHTLMLDDIYDDNDGVAGENLLTMYGYGNYRELLKDTLQRGDHLGVSYIYP